MKSYLALPILVIAAAFATAVASAAAPRDELLQLVPRDMNFCLVLQNLREKRDADHALNEAITALPAMKAWQESPELKKLSEVQAAVLKELDVTLPQLENDIFGDATVLAYRKPATMQPGQEQGLFMCWARDRELLAQLIGRINERQKKSGEVKTITSVVYNGTTYFRRTKSNTPAGGSDFYFVRDHLIAFSNSEEALKAAIDRLGAPADDKAAAYWSGMLNSLGFDKSLVAILVNPRSFDEALAAQESASTSPAERALFREFRAYWSALDGLGACVDIDKLSLEVGFAAQVRPEALPAAAATLFGGMRRPSALWKVIPEDALVAVAARTDLKSMSEFFTGFWDEGTRRLVQQSVRGGIRPFLPEGASSDWMAQGLGPDWGVWATRPAEGWCPELTVAVKVQDNPAGAAAVKAAQNAVQFLTTMVQLAAKDAARVENTMDGKVEIRSLVYEKELPAELRPSFAVKDGYMLFASSPELIRRFQGPQKSVEDADESLVLRISAASWAAYLGKHKAEIVRGGAPFLPASPTIIERQIDQLLPNLRQFDQLEVAVRGKPKVAAVVLRVKMKAKGDTP